MGQVVVRPRHFATYPCRPARHFAAVAATSSAAVRGPSGATNHPAGRHRIFRNAALYGALPLILVAMANCLVGGTKAEEANKQGQEKPARIKYEYLRRQTKPFPWGDGSKSFFEKD